MIAGPAPFPTSATPSPAWSTRVCSLAGTVGRAGVVGQEALQDLELGRRRIGDGLLPGPQLFLKSLGGGSGPGGLGAAVLGWAGCACGAVGTRRVGRTRIRYGALLHAYSCNRLLKKDASQQERDRRGRKNQTNTAYSTNSYPPSLSRRSIRRSTGG